MPAPLGTPSSSIPASSPYGTQTPLTPLSDALHLSTSDDSPTPAHARDSSGYTVPFSPVDPTFLPPIDFVDLFSPGDMSPTSRVALHHGTAYSYGAQGEYPSGGQGQQVSQERTTASPSQNQAQAQTEWMHKGSFPTPPNLQVHSFPTVPLPNPTKILSVPLLKISQVHLPLPFVTPTDAKAQPVSPISSKSRSLPVPQIPFPGQIATTRNKVPRAKAASSSEQPWHQNPQAPHASHHPTQLPPFHTIQSHSREMYPPAYAPGPYPYGAVTYQHPTHTRTQPFTYHPSAHGYAHAPPHSHAQYAQGQAMYDPATATYTPMTAGYHAAPPPPFVNPSMIQPVTYPAWQDPARRTVSGDAFAPPGERERKNSQGSIEAKEEERWDERQPLSPSLSHGTEEDIHHAHQHSHVLSHPPAHLQSEQDGQISQFKDGIVYTDDAETKQTAELKRKCYNCQATNPPSWRKSVIRPGKIACNKCGIYERTHHRARPRQNDEQKLRRATPMITPRRDPPAGLQMMAPSPDGSPIQSPFSAVPSQTPHSSASTTFPNHIGSPFTTGPLTGRRGSHGSLISTGPLGTPLSGPSGTPILAHAAPMYGSITPAITAPASTPGGSTTSLVSYAYGQAGSTYTPSATNLTHSTSISGGHGRSSPYAHAYSNRRAMSYQHPHHSAAPPPQQQQSQQNQDQGYQQHPHRGQGHTGVTPALVSVNMACSPISAVAPTSSDTVIGEQAPEAAERAQDGQKDWRRYSDGEVNPGLVDDKGVAA